MRKLPPAIVLLLLTTAGCGSSTPEARVPEAQTPDAGATESVTSTSAPRSEVIPPALGECTIGWHKPIRASVLTIPEDVAVEAFEPVRVALCACPRSEPEARVALRFDFGLGEVTASSSDTVLDTCLKAKLRPGRFRAHPEIPASDVVDPAAARPASGPLVMLPIVVGR